MSTEMLSYSGINSVNTPENGSVRGEKKQKKDSMFSMGGQDGMMRVREQVLMDRRIVDKRA